MSLSATEFLYLLRKCDVIQILDEHKYPCITQESNPHSSPVGSGNYESTALTAHPPATGTIRADLVTDRYN